MKNAFIEAGEIVNTHGIQGEVKIVPWADSAEFLKKFKRFFIEGKEFEVASSRCHSGNLIAKFKDIADMNAAIALKGKVILIDRSDVNLPKGSYFLADIVSAEIHDEDGNKIGILKEILERPASNIYVITKKDGTETLVPAVSEFIKKVDADAGIITVHLIEGM